MNNADLIGTGGGLIARPSADSALSRAAKPVLRNLAIPFLFGPVYIFLAILGPVYILLSRGPFYGITTKQEDFSNFLFVGYAFVFTAAIVSNVVWSKRTRDKKETALRTLLDCSDGLACALIVENRHQISAKSAEGEDSSLQYLRAVLRCLQANQASVADSTRFDLRAWIKSLRKTGMRDQVFEEIEALLPVWKPYEREV